MEKEHERKRMFCPMMKELCVGGHTKSMGEDQDGIQVKCRYWTHLVGKDPQSENMIDQWDCAIAWVPVMLVENAQMSRHVAASTDKVANEVNRQHRTFATAIEHNFKTRLLDAENIKKEVQSIEHKNGI